MVHKSAWSEFRDRKLDFLGFAISSARAAGKIQMDLYNSSHSVEWTGRVHFRSETDTRVSAMLRKELAETYPDHNIHSEESVDHKTGSPFTWVDDELDGTIGYVRRLINDFSFCRGLCIHDVPVLGVIIQPKAKRLYVGVIDESSRLYTLNDNLDTIDAQSISVNSTDTLNKVHMSFYGGKEIKGKEKFCETPLDFHRKALRYPDRIACDLGFACASATLCAVADGRQEACLATGLEPEDMTAAVPILRGAGAVGTNIALEPWRLGNKSILTANLVIHAALSNKFKDVITEHIAKWGI